MPCLLDFWYDPPGWTTFLYGTPKGAIFYPCELVHFFNEDQSVAFVLAEEPDFWSRGFVYLRLVDRHNARISETKTIIAKIDGITVGNLTPINRELKASAEAEVFKLDDFIKNNGHKLQIITDNAIYEADATSLPTGIRDLQACQRERAERLKGTWNDDDYPQFHRQKQ